jgi:hypothetical protein
MGTCSTASITGSHAAGAYSFSWLLPSGRASVIVDGIHLFQPPTWLRIQSGRYTQVLLIDKEGKIIYDRGELEELA